MSLLTKILTGGGATIKVSATPAHALIDDPIKIQVTGLQASQPITVTAGIDENNKIFISNAHYTANQNGRVDLSTMPSTGGSYTGVEPMGLFWSMKQAPGQSPGLALSKKDVRIPYTVPISVFDGHLDASTCSQSSMMEHYLGQQVTTRGYLGQGVTRQPIREGQLRGTLFTPQGSGLFPALIDLYGTAGGLKEHRAALLASRGFLSLSLAFFDYEDLPKDINEIDLQYFVDAAEWLAVHPKATPGGVGMIGLSKGAEISMFTSSVCDKIKAAVCINANDYIVYYELSYKGVRLPCIEYDSELCEISSDGIVSKEVVRRKVPEARIKVENTKGALLIIQGADDLSNASTAANELQERNKKWKKDNLHSLLYPGAGHFIEPPYVPLNYASYHKQFDIQTVWGGEMYAHARAQEDAWPKVLYFLRRYLPKKADDSKL